ncbi:hypothetical protein VTN49DRAFT_3503 [Thermomyces lanuginosus]|uniref:uncharacterized protein n=1 Tax=Thermomyces lanuginosus TaxID=5541 RepID=UPI003742C22F
MRPATLTVDGLWYCLCPSFHQSYVLRPVSSFFPSRPTRPCRFSRGLRNGAACRRNHYSSLQALNAHDGRDRRHNGERTEQRCLNPPAGFQRPDASQRTLGRLPMGPGVQRTPARKPEQMTAMHSIQSLAQEKKGLAEGKPVRRRIKVSDSITRRTTEELETTLQRLSSKAKPNMQYTMQILRTLIAERNVQPRTRHYRALIQANADPELGSADNVRRLLREMEENAIAADSATLHAALQALSVHPDPQLRQEVLQTMRDRWLSLSPAGWHYVVAGLLREEQYELALERLEHMNRIGIPVQQWLHSMIVYTLCDLKEYDLALQLIKNRTNQHLDTSKDLLLHVLDVTSAALHHEATSYIWKQLVELEGSPVPFQVCEQVFRVAARHGNPQLAESALQFLFRNNMTPTAENVENVAAAYAVTGDLSTAMEVLCYMEEQAGIPVTERSTQSILDYMTKRQVSPNNIWRRLTKLKEKKKIPISVGCANVVLRYCQHAYTRKPNPVPQAMTMALRFYKDIFYLCTGGKANVETYNIMFSFCRVARRPDVCMFFVKEMAALEVVPNERTLELLILMCLEMKNYESAYKYFVDFEGNGWTLSRETATDIRRFCEGSEDETAKKLMEHAMVTESNDQAP